MRHRLLAATATSLAGLAIAAGAAQGEQLPVLYNGILGYAHVDFDEHPDLLQPAEFARNHFNLVLVGTGKSL